MNRPKKFGLFDPELVVKIDGHHLPHWFQEGAAIFVTGRTADSLPKQVVLRMQQSLVKWLAQRQLPITLGRFEFGRYTPEQNRLIEAMPPLERAEYRRQVGQLLHLALDNCHGQCLLRQHEIAKIVAEHLIHFDGQRYDLDSFVIMPNHFHAIVQFRKGFDLKMIGQSWLRFSARNINKHLGRTGPLWQDEPFDHVIRSVRQFHYLRGYIRDNPLSIQLPADQYFYHPPK